MTAVQALKNQAKNFDGTVIGAGIGLVAALEENRGVKDNLQNQTIAQLQAEIAQLKSQQSQQNHIIVARPVVGEFLAGLSHGRMRRENGEWIGAQRPIVLEMRDIERLSFPGWQTVYDAQRTIMDKGQSFRLGEHLSLPDVQAVVFALAHDEAPRSERLRQIWRSWKGLARAFAETGTVSALSAAQEAALAAQIVADPLHQDQIKNLFQMLLSPAVQSVLLGIAGTGPVSQTQAAQIAAYHQQVYAQLLSLSPVAGAAVQAWIASQSPALADSALDASWAYTYNPSPLTGTPTYTGAQAGGIVTGAAVSSVAFKFIAGPGEQQTVRRFRLTITNLSSAAAGVAARCFLPLPLKNQAAPKVTLTVEGNTQAQAGYPYVNNVLGGPTPSFDIDVVAGTNSAVFNLICDVTD